MSLSTIGNRNSCARYSVRYSGKNAFVWTSNAYAHSTKESAGVEWDGGESSNLFAVNHRTVAMMNPDKRKSRRTMRAASVIISTML